MFESIVGNGKPTNNVFNSRALLFALADTDVSGKAKYTGYKQQVNGGRLFEYPIEYAENTNFGMVGEMDTLPTTRIDTFDAAQFNQKINAGTVVISDLEVARNAAENRKIDVVAAKLENAKNSATANMNRALWGGDGLGNNFDGLTKIISATPTSGTVGGINRATFSFWRNRQNSGAKTSTAFDNLRSSWTTTYNQCSLGGVDMTPSAIITDRTVFEGYEGTLVLLEKIERGAKATGGDSAFLNEALQFKGADVFYDEDAATYAPGEARFLNPKALALTVLAGYWMKMKPPIGPANQLAEVTQVETFGNLGCNGSRYLGVTTAIT